MQSARALIYVLILSLFTLSAHAANQASTLRQAQTGDMEAQFKLGYLYQSLGKNQSDFQTAIRWYKKAAASGQARAAFALGLMYEHGQGVEKNVAKAIDWYERAAEIYAYRDAGFPYKLAKDAVARTQPGSLILTQQNRTR